MHYSDISTGDIQACGLARDRPHLVHPRAGGPKGGEVTMGTSAPAAAGCPVQSCPRLRSATTDDWPLDRAGTPGLTQEKGLWDQFWLGIWRLWKVEVVPNSEPPPKIHLSPFLAQQQSVLPVPLGRPELALH